MTETDRPFRLGLVTPVFNDWDSLSILLGRIAIGDWLTVLIGIVSLAALFRWKVSNPLLIAATAVVGLIAYPWLQPGWVIVH